MRVTTQLIEEYLGTGNFDAIRSFTASLNDYHDIEELVTALLRNTEEMPADLLDSSLEAFIKSREPFAPEHGYWVHSLSHFTELLWKRGMKSRIEQLNEIAFHGANELYDSNCSDRLVGDFGKYAAWDDNPNEFGLTPTNLAWMSKGRDYQYLNYAKKRIGNGTFSSEEEFLRWKIQQPEIQKGYNGVEFKSLESIILRLSELGCETSDEKALKITLLTEQVIELETKLQDPTINKSYAENLRKQLQSTKALLEG